MTTSLIIGKGILSLMAVATSVGPFIADFKYVEFLITFGVFHSVSCLDMRDL